MILKEVMNQCIFNFVIQIITLKAYKQKTRKTIFLHFALIVSFNLALIKISLNSKSLYHELRIPRDFTKQQLDKAAQRINSNLNKETH